MNDERGARMSSVLGSSAVVVGNVNGQGDLEVRGRIQGNVVIQGRISVAHGAIVLGSIEAVHVSVLGEVRGDLFAEDGVSIGANGEVEGNISAPRVAIEAGARVRGHLRTGENKEGIRPRPTALDGAQQSPQPVAAPPRPLVAAARPVSGGAPATLQPPSSIPSLTPPTHSPGPSGLAPLQKAPVANGSPLQEANAATRGAEGETTSRRRRRRRGRDDHRDERGVVPSEARLPRENSPVLREAPSTGRGPYPEDRPTTSSREAALPRPDAPMAPGALASQDREPGARGATAQTTPRAHAPRENWNSTPPHTLRDPSTREKAVPSLPRSLDAREVASAQQTQPGAAAPAAPRPQKPPAIPTFVKGAHGHRRDN